MNNPYKVLGVSSLSTKDEIKKKYRELAREYHPDSPNGDAEKFQSIQTAWEYINAYHKDSVKGKEVWRHKSIFTIYKEA